MKITGRGGVYGVPRTELNLDIIGAPYRNLGTQWNRNYSKKYNWKKSKNAICLQIERVQWDSRKD